MARKCLIPECFCQNDSHFAPREQESVPEPIATPEWCLSALHISFLSDLLYKMNESGAQVDGTIEYRGFLFHVYYKDGEHVIDF